MSLTTFNLSQKSKNIPNLHDGYGTGYLTRLEGTGMLRVDKGQPIPLPSLPYPQPAWVSKPMTITNLR